MVFEKGFKVLALKVIVLYSEISPSRDFFPIAMFSVGPEDLGIVKEAGFNTAHTNATVKARFSLDGRSGLQKGVLDFVNEEKIVKLDRGAFWDIFQSYDVHIFRSENSDRNYRSD